jgi:(p)ppGpp synthase/HD superfamily hydrolase
MFKFAPYNTDPIRDEIQKFLTLMGADTVKHSGRTLWTHLLNVYDILKAQGFKQEICSAGGLHSIFGTNAFKKQLLTLNQTNVVVNLIGEEATELVKLFHIVKRPSTLEAAIKNNSLLVELNSGVTKTLTQNELNSICAIEAANLSDQKSLKNYPNIQAFLRNHK